MLRHYCTYFIILILCIGSASFAQDTSADEKEGESATLIPPSLIEYIQAEYPPDAFEKEIEAEVVTKINIDETGIVSDVEIVEPAGQGFDEAALEAIYQFLFQPATRGGTPIPSQVMYRYTFFIDKDEPELEETDEPVPATLKGIIADMDGKGIPKATIVMVNLAPMEDLDTPSEDDSGSLETDKDGGFQFSNLAPGTYQVDVLAPGYKTFSIEETLVEGETKELIYRLELETSVYETVVRARKPPREVTRREITVREIVKIPGTGGDALRSVQNMPGMARAPGFSGELIVRGSSPEDSRYFFDNTPIPLLYHFGGFTSVINSDLLDRIDFYPGNYSVKYGGATGGIIDVYPRVPNKEKFHAYIDADLWDVSLLAEVPIGDKWSIAVSGRRSYVDGILNAVMPQGGGFQFTVAPRYYDYQVVADYHPDKNDNLRLFVFGSDDKMIFLFGEDVVGDPNFTGGVNFRTWFHQAQIRWDHRFNNRVTNEFNVGSGYWGSDSSFGADFKFETDDVPIYVRDELQWTIHEKLILRTGVDIQIHWATWDILAPSQIPSEGEQMDPLDDSEPVATTGQEWFFWPAWYVETEIIPIPDLRIIPGIRLGWFDQIDEFAVDPRLVVRYAIFPKTTIKGGVGLFSQAPSTAKADEDFGNPNLGLIRAMHYSLGVEQDLTDRINLSLEGFYKSLHDLVVSPEDPPSNPANPLPHERYNNDGNGKVYGFEMLLKHHPTDRFFGWVSYTFMNSSRIDHPGWDPRPFDYDQTHILTVVASTVLGRGWEAGIRFRLVTGNPDTPVAGSTYSADSDIYWPISGPTNSDRLPAFHQLDVRVDKKWQFKHLNWSIYVDVQNVYNRKNVEGYQYSYDFSDRVYFYGMPIFPSVGTKLEY